MKKAIFSILAVLTVLALVMTGCPTPGGKNLTSYTVTFDKNGGDTQANPKTKKVISPATTVGTLPTAPTRTGYTFVEWNTESDGSGDTFTASTEVTEDITVYAKWQARPAGSFEVTFDKNATDAVDANPKTKLVSPPATTVGTLPTPPTRTGFTFVEWNTKADGTGTAFAASTTVSADITVFAKWIAAGAKIKVTYDFNWPVEGKPADEVREIDAGTFGANLLVPTTAQTPKVVDIGLTIDYAFVEWNTKADGTGDKVEGTTPVTADTKVFGKWALLADVLFTNRDGTPVAGVSIPKAKVGSPIPAAPTAPTRAADTDGTYTFSDWYQDANLNKKWIFGDGGTEVKVGVGEYDIKLYAEWIWVPAASYGAVERVTLANAGQVVYYFETPAGKKWSDYNGVKASYMLETLPEFKVSNSGRATRLYGPYPLNFFGFNTTAIGNKYAFASMDGATNNDAYILDAWPGGGWKSLEDALKGGFGEDFVVKAKDWFTLEYKLDGSRKNAAYAHMPAAGDAGPFIFGLGLPGQDDKNTFFIKDVTLLGVNAADNVTGKAFYIKKQTDKDTAVYSYPAFSAYGTASGSGVDQCSRLVFTPTAANKIEVDAPEEITIIFDLNAGTDATAKFTGGFTGTRKINKGGAVGALPGVERTNYLLNFWAETSTGTTGIAATKTYDANTTLYAIWKEDLPEGTPIPATINTFTLPPGDASAIGTVAEVKGADGTTVIGYKYTYGTENYQRALVWFKIDFATAGITDIKKIKKVQFDYTRNAGDANYKNINMVTDTEAKKPGGDNELNVISDAPASGDCVVGTPKTFTVTLDKDKIATTPLGNFFSIRINASNVGSGEPTAYSITNVTLIPFRD